MILELGYGVDTKDWVDEVPVSLNCCWNSVVWDVGCNVSIKEDEDGLFEKTET